MTLNGIDLPTMSLPRVFPGQTGFLFQPPLPPSPLVVAEVPAVAAIRRRIPPPPTPSTLSWTNWAVSRQPRRPTTRRHSRLRRTRPNGAPDALARPHTKRRANDPCRGGTATSPPERTSLLRTHAMKNALTSSRPRLDSRRFEGGREAAGGFRCAVPDIVRQRVTPA